MKGLSMAFRASLNVPDEGGFVETFTADRLTPQVAAYVAQVAATPVTALEITKIEQFFKTHGPGWARPHLSTSSDRCPPNMNTFWTLALDVLATPVSVASVERAHSVHRNVFSERRRKMGFNMAYAAQLFAANKERAVGFLRTLTVGM